jgi:hypothetical protein
MEQSQIVASEGKGEKDIKTTMIYTLVLNTYADRWTIKSVLTAL